jgi:hypothetical protein
MRIVRKLLPHAIFVTVLIICTTNVEAVVF